MLKACTDTGGGPPAVFQLPIATRAAAAAAAPELEELLDSLSRIPCANDPVVALCAVADALARRHAAQCVPGAYVAQPTFDCLPSVRFPSSLALLSRALQVRTCRAGAPAARRLTRRAARGCWHPAKVS